MFHTFSFPLSKYTVKVLFVNCKSNSNKVSVFIAYTKVMKDISTAKSLKLKQHQNYYNNINYPTILINYTTHHTVCFVIYIKIKLSLS